MFERIELQTARRNSVMIDRIALISLQNKNIFYVVTFCIYK